jgi:pyruvate dehydrogenase E2 component (dihydrolipoamide acetyltransferase)
MDIRLPRLGEGADSGTVASLFVKEGDTVKKDQAVLELESDKAVATIPSPSAGVVSAIHVREGDVIKVGQLILTLSTEGTAAQAVAPAPVPAPAAADIPASPVFTPAPAAPAGPASAPAMELPSGAAPGVTPPASPTVRKVARELGIELWRVGGSERGGRVTMADLKGYVGRLQQAAFAPRAASPGTAPAPTPALPPPVDFAKWGTVERKKMTTLRRTISDRMVQSWTTLPHITQFDTVDVSDLLALKKKYGAKYEKQGAPLTLTAFLLKALVPVLKQHPLFNASMDERAGEIVLKKYYHVGIAVDTEQGLIVPVLRDVDRKSLLDLARELNTLAERTRARKVALEEMQGGSFTISNQGGIGGGAFTPIINKPEVAILGVGRGALQPVVREGKVVPRTLLPLGLSYDHRVIDGADAARFIVDLVKAIEGLRESEVKI